MTVVTQILDRMPAIAQPQRKFLGALFSTLLVVRGSHKPRIVVVRRKDNRHPTY